MVLVCIGAGIVVHALDIGGGSVHRYKWSSLDENSASQQDDTIAGAVCKMDFNCFGTLPVVDGDFEMRSCRCVKGRCSYYAPSLKQRFACAHDEQ